MKLIGGWKVVHLVLALVCRERDIHGSLCLVIFFVRGDVDSRKGLIHQLLIPNLFEVATRRNVQLSVEDFNLFKGLIKTLDILLDRFTFKVLSILGLGVEHFLELNHLNGIVVLMLLEFLLQGDDLVLEYFLLSLSLLLLG